MQGFTEKTSFPSNLPDTVYQLRCSMKNLALLYLESALYFMYYLYKLKNEESFLVN